MQPQWLTAHLHSLPSLIAEQELVMIEAAQAPYLKKNQYQRMMRGLTTRLRGFWGDEDDSTSKYDAYGNLQLRGYQEIKGWFASIGWGNA